MQEKIRIFYLLYLHFQDGNGAFFDVYFSKSAEICERKMFTLFFFFFRIFQSVGILLLSLFVQYAQNGQIELCVFGFRFSR